MVIADLHAETGPTQPPKTTSPASAEASKEGQPVRRTGASDNMVKAMTRAGMFDVS